MLLLMIIFNVSGDYNLDISVHVIINVKVDVIFKVSIDVMI